MCPNIALFLVRQNDYGRSAMPLLCIQIFNQIFGKSFLGSNQTAPQSAMELRQFISLCDSALFHQTLFSFLLQTKIPYSQQQSLYSRLEFESLLFIHV